MMNQTNFICQLPITEQQKIIFKAQKYLSDSGMCQNEIDQCIENIMDSKIIDVLNPDGSFCT